MTYNAKFLAWALACAPVGAAAAQPGAGTPPPLPRSSPDAIMTDDGVRGTLVVRAVQGTKGAPDVGADEVELVLLHRDQPVKQMKLSLDERGILFVGDLPVSMGLRPLVRIKHAGVLYQESGPLFNAGKREVAMDVVVYETTDERPAWRIVSRQIGVKRSEDVLRVREEVVAENPSDRTWLGDAPKEQGRRDTVVLTLPPGAVDISLDSGFHGWCCTEYAGGRLAVQMPLMPGRATFRYGYRVPIQAGRVELRFGTAAPTEQCQIIVPDDGSIAEPAGMQGGGVETVNGTRVRLFRSGPIAGGESAGVVLTGMITKSTVAATEESSSMAKVAGGILLGVIGTGLAAFLVVRRAKAQGGGV